jgi:hypothetical protein
LTYFDGKNCINIDTVFLFAKLIVNKIDERKLYMNFNDAYKTLDNLYESRRIISDPDVLYHYTNPTPFVKILKENCLRSDVKTEAVCLTTDKDYVIYNYPCGFQFSRQKLLQDGYKLELYDNNEANPESRGESEERILRNIDNVTKYITAVYINWQGRKGAEIPIVYDGDVYKIADARYDQQGNEYEEYALPVTDFRFLLASLKARGIPVIERGRPQYGKYYLDSDGKLQCGMPNIDTEVV